METDDALGSARRNKWTTGAGGGGGHQDAATHALADSKSTSRSSTGVRKNLVGLGSHESLQPFSRDASKSRKSSIADSDSERQQALKLTSQIVSSRPLLDASHSPVPDSAHPAALADSNGTPSPSITSGPTDANDIDIDIDEDRIQRGILHDVKEYCTDAVKIQEVFDEMMERCAQAPPSTIFRLLMKAAVEETLNAHDRRYIGQLLCRCLQADHIRAEALKGIADYARSAINDELWVDVPNLWEYMAEVLLWAILCDMKHFDGHRPSLDDFAETFQTAQQDTRKPHVLLLLVLKRLFETFDEKGVAQFAFAEMRVISPDTPDLIEALKATTVDGSDLYTLLTQ
uniref:MI domain-containing protein n=1 Tax=Plectus sambesii TaxID=2011161 RepID=A0A914WQS8_9BILA